MKLVVLVHTLDQLLVSWLNWELPIFSRDLLSTLLLRILTLRVSLTWEPEKIDLNLGISQVLRFLINELVNHFELTMGSITLLWVLNRRSFQVLMVDQLLNIWLLGSEFIRILHANFRCYSKKKKMVWNLISKFWRMFPKYFLILFSKLFQKFQNEFSKIFPNILIWYVWIVKNNF